MLAGRKYSGVAQPGRRPAGNQRRPNKASAACGTGGISLSNATPGLGGDQDPSAEKTQRHSRMPGSAHTAGQST
jgi:hypothetical protein